MRRYADVQLRRYADVQINLLLALYIYFY